MRNFQTYIGSDENCIKKASAEYEPFGEINVAFRLKKTYNNI